MIVIADDITGAAEIAGIAREQGRTVRLICWDDETATAVCDLSPYSGVTVVATDTRSMSEAEAIAQTEQIAARLAQEGVPIFKKTDSALRGHVTAELSTLMELTGYRRAVYLPANPSKGRIISEGVYRIDGRPIHETDFAHDPEFPARTSTLKERFPDASAKGIVMPNAEATTDIRQAIEKYDDGHTMFAGAADLFREVLSAISPASYNKEEETEGSPKSCGAEHGNAVLSGALILCGSTQSRPLELGIPVAPMPRSIYDGATDLSLWPVGAYSEGRGLILTIPHTHRTGKQVAVHLRAMMSAMAARLVSQRCPTQLIVEGGATAWATLTTLGWKQFTIERQVAPGVVQMSATSGTLVTLKPGSYPWGGLFTGL